MKSGYTTTATAKKSAVAVRIYKSKGNPALSYLSSSAEVTPLIAPEMRPATGNTIHVICQSFVVKLQMR